MASEYGAPHFFLTFTANEMGWRDLTNACGGAPFGARPVEATRHYNQRWKEFNERFLRGETPLGNIVRTWYRHEEQGRGSLHVHMAVWIEGTPHPEAICARAPREEDCETEAEREWRRFVLRVQQHNCQRKCHYHQGEWKGDAFCKVGYPRPLFNRATCEQGKTPWKQPGHDDFLDPNPHPELEPADYYLVPETERYIYQTDVEEDRRLSTYVPLMLLAWGANMNAQYCTTSGFLSYIAKCAPRPSPHASSKRATRLTPCSALNRQM